YFDYAVLNVGAFAGFISFLLAIGVQFLIWRLQLAQATAAAATLAKNLAAEFPSVVSTIGGEPAITDLGAAEQFQSRITAAEGPELRQKAVQILLDRLADRLRRRDTTGLPIVQIVLVSVPIAYPFG